ncbi:nuclear transport factor 2 family protein [Sulfuricurvum sp.]|uniref:nuclear transport factor 2 family protein n=1 Tax=Sulfuricurvum sp. TaxID=2025608 RepID=UPI003C4A1213
MKTPQSILTAWMNAVNNGDVEGLLALYDKDAVLIPTFSNKQINSPEKLREYFEKLGTREELSIALHEKTLQVQQIKDEVWVLSGIYNWRFDVDGELLNFEARFSYIFDLTKSRPIIHHHSSQIPRMVC